METTNYKISSSKTIMQEENKFLIILKQIWPTIYRVLNATLYFVFTVIRSLVKGGINQIKND